MRFINDGELHGLQITNTIVPCTDKDEYATHDSQYGLGGWHEVETLAQRDKIPEKRRRLGMACYVKSESKLYILKNNITNTGWIVFAGSTNAVDIIREAIASGQIQVDVDLGNYYTIDQINTMLEPLAATTDVNTEILNAVDEIKTWVANQDYVNQTEADNKFLSKEQAALDYVNVTVFDEFKNNTTEGINTITTNLEELTNTSATKEALEEVKTALEEVKTTYVTTEELNNRAYLDETEVGTFLQNNNYVTEEKLNELQVVDKENADELLVDYAKKTDLATLESKVITVNDLKGYATVALLNDTVNNLDVLSIRDLQGYATEAWVRDYVAINGGTGSESGTVDLTAYAKKSDLTIALADYVTEEVLAEKNYVPQNDLLTAISRLEARIELLETRLDALENPTA